MENFILIEYFSNQTFQLFLLVKMMQMRYLYVCVVKIISNGCKWLVGKTGAINIIRMLKDELTLRELVRGYSSGRISVDYIDGEYRVEYNNSDWNEDSIYLPKEDSYMFADEGEFADDISYYSHVN